MPDKKYCYPNSSVLKNKLNIKDAEALFEAEKEITAARLFVLQKRPIKGNFDFDHLKRIHQYIFQDIYDWAGKERTVDIGKGNLFCKAVCIPEYSKEVFGKYAKECFAAKNNPEAFIKALAENYGDLNALHPFREGNGRAQREFARELCLECGYHFSLYQTTHEEMLEASIRSFNMADNSLFENIFSEAVTLLKDIPLLDYDRIDILTSNDMEKEEIDDIIARAMAKATTQRERFAPEIIR